MVHTETLKAHPYVSQTRFLLQAAMLIFAYTVVIGILNGTDLVDFGHKTLLTHVHTGTLGWITTSVFAAALWLFGATPGLGWRDSFARTLPYATVLAVVAYNIAFLATTGSARPTMGGFMLLVILGWVIWIFGSARSSVLSVPRLGILAAVTTLTFGGLLGVLLGVMIATGNDILPGDAYASHPATMVIGFLIPVGMALAEWNVRPELLEQRATRSGWLQIGLPFIGGICVTAGLLADSPPLISLSLPFEVIGVGIFVKRLWPGLRRVDRARATSGFVASPTVLWLVLNIMMFIYLIVRFQGDLDDVRPGLFLALDHMMFIGVISNSLFAQVRAAAPDAKPAAVRVLFYAMNVGLAGFVLGLLADTAILKQIFTPLMGLGILHGIALFTMALRKPTATVVPPTPA
ncbi:MAG TPA: hypothetical protein VFF07_05040 [Actinomycetota bacterium]|nr:hypothetical protein [Actinomycetota bacterium]